MHSKGQIRHANELVAFLRSGVMTALKRLQNVDESSQAHQARAEDGSTPDPLFVSVRLNPASSVCVLLCERFAESCWAGPQADAGKLSRTERRRTRKTR